MTKEQTTENKELTTFQTSLYPALSEEAVVGIKEAMEANFSGQQIDPRKVFSIIKFPSGGSTSWEIPIIDGEPIDTKEFTGIIMHVGIERARYVGKYGEGDSVPACTSPDGLHGIGEPGGDCMNCAYNQFDTHPEHKGRKACSETKPIYFIMKETGDFAAEEWPMILRTSAGSLGVLDDYRIKLAKSRTQIHTIETKFTLLKTQNKNNIAFSQLVLSRGDKITDQKTIDMIKSYKSGISPFIMPQQNFATSNAA